MSVIPDQLDVEIPVTALPIDIAVLLAPAAVDGVIYLKDTGHFVSSAIFLESLMKQKIARAIDPGRRQAGLGIATGAGLAGSVLLCISPVGPLVFAAWLIGTFAVPLHTAPRVCTIVILNLTSGKLTKKATYLANGLQTGHPAISDGSTKFASADNVDIVPGLIQTDTTYLASVGVYQFQKNLQQVAGFVGTAGALRFEVEDPKAKGKQIGIAWNVPEGFWDDDDTDPNHRPIPGLGITSDLYGNYGTIEAFYGATAAAPTSKINRSDNTGGIKIDACYWPRVFDKTSLTYDPHERLRDLVLTVLIQ